MIRSPRDTTPTNTDSVPSLRDPAPFLHLDGDPNQSSAKAGVSLMLVHVACNVCRIISSKAETYMGNKVKNWQAYKHDRGVSM